MPMSTARRARGKPAVLGAPVVVQVPVPVVSCRNVGVLSKNKLPPTTSRWRMSAWYVLAVSVFVLRPSGVSATVRTIPSR